MSTMQEASDLSKLKEAAGDDAALDTLSIYTIRLLAADMVDKASSGHLGTPFGCAPLANALWGKIMHFSPFQRWLNRDRFVLSVGHASALLYVMLHLTGNGLGGQYVVSMERLKQFRQAGSSTPGHPEFRMTSGVEVTTGPLGQGFANAVGMAIAEAHLAARFNKEGFPLFDNYTYVLAGDGCLMEGVSQEAASLAGHLKLSKLIVFYDDNKITIDGGTNLAFSEDTATIFAAKGWNVIQLPNGDSHDPRIFEKAVEEAKSQTEKPSIIVMRTTIGAGAGPNVEGKSKAHGGKFANLEEIRAKYFSPDGLRKSGQAVDKKVAEMVESEMARIGEKVLPKFFVPSQVERKFRQRGDEGDQMACAWNRMVGKYCRTFRESEPNLVQDLEDRMHGKYLSDNWRKDLDEYLRKEMKILDANLGTLLNHAEVREEEVAPPPFKRLKSDGALGFKQKAGRVYASEVLKCLVQNNPAIMGGAADVASSCGVHFPELQGHFLPASRAPGLAKASYAGRYIHFGVREHAMLAILNGVCSYSLIIPYGCTFTVFFQYGTHDSIDVGEDGPTHQPVEVLPQLRAMPNLLVVRPADVSETVGAFEVLGDQYANFRDISQYVDPKPLARRPVFLMTSRGELGFPYKPNAGISGREGVKRGAYVVHDCFDVPMDDPAAGLVKLPTGARVPDIILIGSGQDVGLCMKAKEILLKWSSSFYEQLHKSFDGPVPLPVSHNQPCLKIRIISMPCWELFDEQDQDYQESVLLSNYTDVLSIYVEKAATKNTGHDKYAQYSVLMPSFGLSGKGADVERKLEFTEDFVASKVWAAWIDRGRHVQVAADTGDRGFSTWVSRMARRVGGN
ncbi:unnamed protein product [Effrenium voratum]|uniref:Transketolase-like pyrimidine-binding domain-containing protein n=1 Tax=Effrenium voratum TaxID=2562239 RepID=A0AA36MX24_9DINO|nr:unnamed protein product [Effrenium voratum]